MVKLGPHDWLVLTAIHRTEQLLATVFAREAGSPVGVTGSEIMTRLMLRPDDLEEAERVGRTLGRLEGLGILKRMDVEGSEMAWAVVDELPAVAWRRASRAQRSAIGSGPSENA